MSASSGIAVVVTCFNLGRPLPEALESIARQTLQPAEVVVVDDGSDDLYTRETLQAIRRTGRTVIDLPHGGVSAARNAGIEATTSPLVVLLDADDGLEPTYLAKAAARLQQDHHLAFVGCGMRSVGELESEWYPPAPDLVTSLCRGVVPICSMFRRDMWTAVGGFDSNLDGLEDTDFWVSALALGFRGEVLPEVLMRYRVRTGSLHDRTVASGEHEDLLARIYEKHRAALEPHALRIVIEREAFIAEQQTHLEALSRRRGERLNVLQAGRTEVLRLQSERIARGEPLVDFGDLARTSPFSDVWGLDRGLPVDRHFIHSFLEAHRADIRGSVLEVKDAGYTRMFGNGVTRSDVLDIDPLNANATLRADLSAADSIPPEIYDCFILTQTLGLIADPSAAVGHALRVLRPGGVLLCTVPAAGRLSPEGSGRDGDYWRFTEASVRELFSRHVAPGQVEIQGFGNVLALTAFNYGLAAHEIPHEQLAVIDPDFPLVYCIRIVKPVRGAAVATRHGAARLAVLMYHQITEQAGRRGAVTPSAFREQLDSLRNAGVELVSLGTIADRLASADNDPAIAVTIDDGYRDSLDVAAPILAEYAAPATFFVTSGALEPAFAFPWDRLDALLDAIAPQPSIEVTLDGARRLLPWDSAQDRAHTADTLLNVVCSSAPAAINALLAELAALATSARPHSSDTMDRAALIALTRLPRMAIGAHSVSHLWLPAQSMPVRFSEIWESRERLEQVLERDVDTFAYPYGGCDVATRALVEASGFRVAVTTDARCCRSDDSPLLLPRVDAAVMSSKDIVGLVVR